MSRPRSRRPPARRPRRQAAAELTPPEDRNPGGRPPLDLDAEQIETLAGMQCSTEEIAAVVKCRRTGVHPSKRTLERNYAEAMDRGRLAGKASLKRTQYVVAMGESYEEVTPTKEGERRRTIYTARPNPTMLIWLGKVVLGQKETVARELGGIPGGQPIPVAGAGPRSPADVAAEIEGIISLGAERARRERERGEPRAEEA